MLSEVEIAGEFVRRFYDYWRTDADRLYCFYDAASVVSNAFFSVAGRAVLFYYSIAINFR